MALKRKNGRRCRFESLETRQMLAGDVKAIVTNSGTAKITGDNYSNGVTIAPGLNEFEVVVTGINAGGLATRVNGVPNGAVTLPNVIHGMEVNLGNGNNIVRINNLNNNGALKHQINGKASVKTGNGVDDVRLNNDSFGSSLKIKTGKSADVVQVTTVTVKGKATVKSGTGSDVVTITNDPSVNYLGALKISLGKGNDNLNITGASVITQTALNGGKGINVFNNGISNFYGGILQKQNLNGGWGG